MSIATRSIVAPSRFRQTDAWLGKPFTELQARTWAETLRPCPVITSVTILRQLDGEAHALTVLYSDGEEHVCFNPADAYLACTLAGSKIEAARAAPRA